jgi:hypothetical protein
MWTHASVLPGLPQGIARPGIPLSRLLTLALIAGVVLSGVAFAYFSAFICLVPYDDEGVVLLFVQHMLDGHAIYDRVNCLYGPFYLFLRWVVFCLLHVPLGNDALRVQALVTWLATTLLLALTSWQLGRRYAWRAGLTALVWIVSITQLFVLSWEPGHPQELVALLVATALFVAATMRERRRTLFLILGGLGAAILLTKVNVGVFYLLALALSLVALTPRPSPAWFVLRVALALATVVLPWMLMKSRFGDGYGGFCLLTTAAVIPCLALACFGSRGGTVRLAEVFWCALGIALVTGPMVLFALWQGNTLTGMADAIYLRTWRNFARAPVGSPPPVSMSGIVSAAAASAVGLAAVVRSGSWVRPALTIPLRLVACVMFLWIGASRNHDVLLPISLGLPLVWLLLVPLRGDELSESAWFFRLFLAFSACLQPLQIFPVSGSQILIGTLVLPIVAVVLTLDVCDEVRDLALLRPHLFDSVVPALNQTAVIAMAVASMQPRTYEIFGRLWTLSSVTSVGTLLAAGAGLVVLQFGMSARRLFLPLKVIVCLWILAGILTSPPWGSAWLRCLPLCWLILLPVSAEAIGPAAAYVRLGLVAGGCLELLHWFPVVRLAGRPFHFAIFLMVAVDVVLLVDVGRELGLGRRWKMDTWSLAARANAVLLASALALGLVAMIDTEEEYRSLVPLDLPGCHLTRMTERDVAFNRFLTANVRHSSDCVFARFGLESLHFWAQQRPACDVVPISNLWVQMDQTADGELLRAHEHCRRMLFIDNPNPWNPVPPKMKFLDYISAHFRPLARVSAARLLVHEGRTDIALYDCAYERRAAAWNAGDATLIVRLPGDREGTQVARIELVDLSKEPADQLLASTADPEPRQLTFTDSNGRRYLSSGTWTVDSSHVRGSLRMSIPASIEWRIAGFAALRFCAADGRRVFTLPIALDVADIVR